MRATLCRFLKVISAFQALVRRVGQRCVVPNRQEREHTMGDERTSKRRWAIPGLAATTALVAVLGGTAAAQQSAPADRQATQETQEDRQEPTLNGSVTAPEGPEEVSEDLEAAQLQQLPGLISEQEAVAAATADGGTADAASLEDENGSVVYEVAVTAADGTVQEVTVDAGNGQILAREADDEGSGANDDEGSEADEGPEGSEADEGPEGNEGTAPSDAGAQG